MISDLPESEIKITFIIHEKKTHDSGAYYKQNSQSDKWAKSQCLLLFSMRSPYLIVHGTHIVNIVFKFIVHSWFNAYNTQDLQLKSNIILHIGNAKFIKTRPDLWLFSIFNCNVHPSLRLHNYRILFHKSKCLFYSPLTKKSKISNEIFEPPAESHLKAIYKRYKHHIL